MVISCNLANENRRENGKGGKERCGGGQKRDEAPCQFWKQIDADACCGVAMRAVWRVVIVRFILHDRNNESSVRGLSSRKSETLFAQYVRDADVLDRIRQQSSARDYLFHQKIHGQRPTDGRTLNTQRQTGCNIQGAHYTMYRVLTYSLQYRGCSVW